MRKPSASSLEFTLLGALAEKAQSGYDLRKMMVETPMRQYSDSPGSIYPALQRLKARKWVSAASDKTSARGRAVFQITPAGKAALLAWLQEPFGRDEIMRHLDVLLLRFAFFDGNLPRKQAIAYLKHFERELEEHVAELEAFAASSGITAAIGTGALAFSYGLETYRGLLDWTKRAQARLAKAAG